MSKNTKRTRLFVYGTLKRGFRLYDHYDLKKNSVFCCEASIKNARMYSMGIYPIVVLDGKSDELVYGEVFEVDKKKFEDIKWIEESSGYLEQTVDIEGKPTSMFVFIVSLENSGRQRIENGRWENYANENK